MGSRKGKRGGRGRGNHEKQKKQRGEMRRIGEMRREMKEGNDEENTTKSKGSETTRKSKRRSRRGETKMTMSREIKRHPNTSTTLLGGNADHDHDQRRGWKPCDKRGRGAR